MMKNALEVSQVVQSFPVGFMMKKQKILHEVNLSVPNHSICGFLGPNGAGKTTLIHLIVGIKSPKSGSVQVCGFDAKSDEAKKRLGYLPERPYFYEHLTAKDFLLYFGTLSGLSKKQILDRIPSVLSKVNMLHAKDLELKKFSKGMLQRIGIAQAILHDPEFLVLDEPMSGLDPMGRKEMRELILDLHQQGRTVFFSTHVIPDVEAICDQVAIIHKGKMIGSGKIEDFYPKEEVQIEVDLEKGSEKKLENIDPKKTMVLQDRVRIKLSGCENWNQTILDWLQKGAKILEVKQEKKSLEDIFEKAKATEEENQI